ncbi:MAG: hypothetical protein OEL89_04405 [Candidatus Peregrinibacteria bacterium]|nr:hypothetical protein [Candidatus Peregrinibacteria bacterium]
MMTDELKRRINQILEWMENDFIYEVVSEYVIERLDAGDIYEIYSQSRGG